MRLDIPWNQIIHVFSPLSGRGREAATVDERERERERERRWRREGYRLVLSV